MQEIEWVTEIPSKRKGRLGDAKWVEHLAPLMERPGQPAIIRRTETAIQATSTATNLRRGIVRTPPGRWEFASRKQPDGSGAIYACYLGPDEEG